MSKAELLCGICAVWLLLTLLIGLSGFRAGKKDEDTRTACLTEYRQRGREVSDKCFIYLLDKGYLKLEGK